MTPTEELGLQDRWNVAALSDNIMVKRRMTFVYFNEEKVLFMGHKLKKIRKRMSCGGSLRKHP